MWPFDRSGAHEVLRVGALAIERWSETRDGLELLSREALPGAMPHQAESLIDAIRKSFSVPTQAKVTLVVESAWLPLLLADVGKRVWAPARVQVLLCHRLAALYDDDGVPVSTWDLRVDYIPGDRYALGYGLPPAVRQALLSAGPEVGLRWASMVPAFSWGWQRLRPSQQWRQGTGWWLWPEQDRLLISRVCRSQIVGLNAGAAAAVEASGIEAAVDVEARRLGIEEYAARIDLAAWTTLPGAAQEARRVRTYALAKSVVVGSDTDARRSQRASAWPA